MVSWIKKSSVFFLKQHKRSVLGSLAAILIGALATAFDKAFETMESNTQQIWIINKSLIKHESRLVRLEKEMGLTIKQVDWIAYINRKDGEYHTQQALNHKFFEELGNLKGRQREDEKILYNLLGKNLNIRLNKYK